MVAVDSRIVYVTVVVIVIIIYLVFTEFLIGSQVYFRVLDNVTYLISRLSCISTARLRLRSVNIMLLLRTRSGGLTRNVVLFDVADM